MQLFALERNEALIAAKDAEKGVNYGCLECKGAVRLRAGSQRRAHFYHYSPVEGCRLNAKSMQHIQTQIYLKELLPKGDVLLEYPFPKVKRIADVVWCSKKIVFEVQCSPISVEEVEKRNQDYGRCNYSVVWILHADRYGKERPSSVEQYLWDKDCYYCNFDEEGNGYVYDVADIVKKGRRYFGGVERNIDLSKVSQIKEPSIFPLFYEKKRAGRSFVFGGDFLDLIHSQKIKVGLYQHLHRIERKLAQKEKLAKTFSWKKLYQSFFQWVFESAC